MTADSVPAPMVQVPAECHEEVTRKGHLEPCEKPAVAMRIDPNEGTPYPVCVKHTRADMVPLRTLLDAATPAASVEASGTPACRTGDLTAQVSIPAADILALADRWTNDHDEADECETCWLIQDLRRLVAAAEQADKGEADDTPRSIPEYPHDHDEPMPDVFATMPQSRRVVATIPAAPEEARNRKAKQ